MSKREEKKEYTYEKAFNSAKNVESYNTTTLEQICDYLRHEDSIQTILRALENRKDADIIFLKAVLNNPKFWFVVLTSTVIVSCGINYCFHHYPKTAAHIVEKAVNAQVSDLLPIAY